MCSLLEVGVEILADDDVTAVVDVQRRLDKGALADLAKDLAEKLLAVLFQRL